MTEIVLILTIVVVASLVWLFWRKNTDKTMETIAELEAKLEQLEQARRDNPCCANCDAFYVEHGDECCKCYGVPMIKSERDKCSKWR